MNGSENKTDPGSPSEWLRQLAVKLEQEELEDAARLLDVLRVHAGNAELEQADQMAINQLRELATRRGNPVKLLRCYHVLSAGFLADHPFHSTFLEQMIASIRKLDPGTRALGTVRGIERALDILAPRLEHFPAFTQLHSELNEMRARSTRIVRAELELELHGYVAAGNPKRAIELCRMMIEQGVSPLAEGVLPILEAEGASPAALAYLVGAEGRSHSEAQEHLDRTGWDTPEEASSNYPPEGPHSSGSVPGSGRPPRGTGGPPRTPWSLAFDTPPTGGLEPDSDPGPDIRTAPWGRGWTAPGHGAPERPQGGTTDAAPPPVPGEMEAMVEMLPNIEELPSIGEFRGSGPPPESAPADTTPSTPDPEPTRGDLWRVGSGGTRSEETGHEALPERVPETTSYDAAGPDRREKPSQQPSHLPTVSSERRRLTLVLAAVALGVGLVWWLSGPSESGKPGESAGHQAQTQTPGSQDEGTVTPTIDPDVPDPAERPLGPPGTLSLNITPHDKLELYVDGTLQPDGQVEDLSVPPGKHIVVVYREGYERLRTELWVDPGASATEDLQLLQSPHMNIDVTPSSGVEILLDGRRLLTGLPIEEYSIPAGDHHLEINRPGYESQQFDFTAAPEEKLNYDVTLERLPR